MKYIGKSQIILKIGDWKLERLQNKLYLVNNEKVTDDVFEMIRWSKIYKVLNNESFWDTRITKEDKININAANVIYWLSGDDQVWKTASIWKYDWKDMSIQFMEWFEPSIKKIVKNCQTLGQLKNSISKNIGCEDFYEFGLKHELIIKEENGQ